MHLWILHQGGGWRAEGGPRTRPIESPTPSVCDADDVLTDFVFALFIFYSLENVMHDSASRGIVEKGVFVVNDEAGHTH